MDDSVKFLRGYALTKAEDEPLPVREQVYRAVARIAPSSIEAARLIRLADELREFQRKAGQMLFDFRASE